MDLTTTKIIKYRELDIIPESGETETKCTINVSNWLQNVENLENYKMKISSFYLNNKTIPCFLPKWVESITDLSVYTNKNPALPPTVSYTSAISVLSPTILNYKVAIKDKTANKLYVGYVNMVTGTSEYPDLQPPVHPIRASDQYTNKYYYFFDTTKFCEAVASAFSTIIVNEGLNGGVGFVEIVKTGTGYSLLIEEDLLKVTVGNLDFYIDNNLANIFKFKVEQSTTSTELNLIIPNTQTITYATHTCYTAPTRYVPDTWFPYDSILFRTDGPIEVVTFYTTSNYIPQNYSDIMLSYKLNINDPDSIYNFFTSNINPNSGWCSIRNTNSGENIRFSIELRLKETKDLVPYTIGTDEQAKIEIETLITY